MGKTFLVMTDCSSLRSILTQDKPSARVLRTLLKLADYSFRVVHIAGKKNISDCLSRLKLENAPVIENIEKRLKYPINHNEMEQEVKINFLEENIIQKDEEIFILPKHLDLPNLNEIIKLQGEDEHLKPIIAAIRKKKVLKYKGYYNYFIEKEGQLVYLDIEDNAKSRKIERKKLVIPTKAIAQILNYIHKIILPHFGASLTTMFIKKHMVWAGMVSDIANYITSCKECIARKGKQFIRKSSFGEKTYTPELFSHVFCDMSGPYLTNNEFKYVISSRDEYSRFVILDVLRNCSTKEILQSLVNTVFCRIGLPKYLITDNQSSLISHEFEEAMKSLGITHITISPYSASSAGVIERTHGSLNNILSLITNNLDDWPRNIKIAEYLLNISTHNVLKESPFMAAFGRQPNNLLNNIYKINEEIDIFSDEQNLSIAQRIKNINEVISNNLKAYNKSEYERTNKKFKKRSFDINEEVYLFQPNLQTKKCYKLQKNHCKGPLIVRKKINDVSYHLSSEKEPDKIIRTHVNRMVKFAKRRPYLISEESTSKEDVSLKPQESLTVPSGNTNDKQTEEEMWELIEYMGKVNENKRIAPGQLETAPRTHERYNFREQVPEPERLQYENLGKQTSSTVSTTELISEQNLAHTNIIHEQNNDSPTDNTAEFNLTTQHSVTASNQATNLARKIAPQQENPNFIDKITEVLISKLINKIELM